MTSIVNPFAGYEVLFVKGVPANWAWHKANGYQGGTDYNYPVDRAIGSPADGRATLMNDGLNGVRVTLDDGRSIVIRENRNLVGAFPRDVDIGEEIAVSCRINGTERLAPHIEAWVGGIRVPFEPLVTTTSLAGFGGTTLLTDPTEDDMTTFELAQQKGTPEVFFSVNRIHRYHVTPAMLTDYQAWITALKATNPLANPAVQVVLDIQAFGAIITDAGTITSAPSSPATIDYAALAKAVNDDAAKRMSA